MEDIYPAGPASVNPDLSKLEASYKQRVWLAVTGLCLFVALYLFLASWFSWTGYKLMSIALSGGEGSILGFFVGACAAFLAVFMSKALFFVRRGGEPNAIEIKSDDQPRLFDFLHRLADEAGAPRPHRVFLSPRVNAAVFYDLSVLNLFFPSKKNLEIGLALVNVLNLSELKAVLAHEFGHFGQRTMAVGRWVYIAQQITSHLIYERDILDRFLARLGRFDLRVAWVGWILQLIVWSIRSLLEITFKVVVMAQRALSREMEMQADLVSVSLTGSDSLIHALYKLRAADEAWDRTLQFANSEYQQGRAVSDLFSVQSRLIARMAEILDDSDYGKVPCVPEKAPESHRLFKTQIAHPPKMWSTHPGNSDREENAKRIYVTAPSDDRSGWLLFSEPDQLRHAMSTHIFPRDDESPLTESPIEETIQRLDQQYNKPYFKRRYQGAYLGRSIVRYAPGATQLYFSDLSTAIDELDSLYPESLADDLEQLRNCLEEKAMLEALLAGHMQAAEGVIRHRGAKLQKHEVPGAIEALVAECSTVRERVIEHDKICRSAHLAAAKKLGNGWADYLKGLIHILHYADHNQADLRDLQGVLSNVVAVITADNKVSSSELKRLMATATDLYTSLQRVHEQVADLELDPSLLKRLEVESWQALLADFELHPPSKENINDWMRVIDGWFNATVGGMSALQNAALEQLLVTESFVDQQYREGKPVKAAPPPSRAPEEYATLIPGNERKLQTRLGWWDRFQTADGLVASAMRLIVAVAVISAVLGFSISVGTVSLTIYNGLARSVQVRIDDDLKTVAPFSTAELDLEMDHDYTVTTSIERGGQIESFNAEVGDHFAHYVYNVASAAPLVEWTQIYGNASDRPERYLGVPRWFMNDADIFFDEPPESVRTRSGGASRDILSGFGHVDPETAKGLVKNQADFEQIVRAHVRWDSEQAEFYQDWLQYAQSLADFKQLLQARVQEGLE